MFIAVSSNSNITFIDNIANAKLDITFNEASTTCYSISDNNSMELVSPNLIMSLMTHESIMRAKALINWITSKHSRGADIIGLMNLRSYNPHMYLVVHLFSSGSHVNACQLFKPANKCTGVPKTVYMVTSQGVNKSIYYPRNKSIIQF